MKVQQTPKFVPVVVTLETEEEDCWIGGPIECCQGRCYVSDCAHYQLTNLCSIFTGSCAHCVCIHGCNI
jgi:hypothetical protein